MTNFCDYCEYSHTMAKHAVECTCDCHGEKEYKYEYEKWLTIVNNNKHRE